LIPMTCNIGTATAPTFVDLEVHGPLLESILKHFSKKAPPDSQILEGLRALDNFYRGRLSKSKTKKAQTAWAAKDRVSEQYSWKPGPAAALLVTFGEAARLRSDPWRTYQGLALPALGK
jgi:hypothetical protein